MKIFIFLALVTLQSVSGVFGQSCPLGLSGLYKVGSSGDFPSLQAAMDSLHQKGAAGPVILELRAGYSSAAESFPLEFKAIPCAANEEQVTIRPEAGAHQLTITSNDPTATIDFNNVTHVILDGRAGGADSVSDLLIGNTNLNGSAIRMVNGASWNQVRFIEAMGVLTDYNKGVIWIAGSDSASGNDYNRIDSCHISAGITPPIYGIFAEALLPKNKGNVINGCQIYNVSSSQPVSACGIAINGGNDSMSITNNSIYQTPDRNFPYDTHTQPWGFNGIFVNTLYEGGHTISGNYIGGTAPGAGGPPMLLTHCNGFDGIKVFSDSGNLNASQVSDNTVSNISWSDTYGTFILIQLGGVGGIFNGSCMNNRLGNTGPGTTINVYGPGITTNAMTLIGIDYFGNPYPGQVTVSNNDIGGFFADSTVGGDLIGIRTGFGVGNRCNYSISNNRIGDSAAPNSFWQKASGSTIGIYTYGFEQSSDSIAIENNRIADLKSGASTFGIYYSGGSIGPRRIAGNSIHDLSISSADGGSPGLAGINVSINDLQQQASGAFVCSGNHIYSLTCGSTDQPISGGAEAEGIFMYPYNTTKKFHTEISGNDIGAISVVNPPSSDPLHDLTSIIMGIRMITQGAGASIVDNNMIRLGLTPSGNTFTRQYEVCGICEDNGDNNYIHNSIFVNGVDGVGGFSTACLGVSGSDTSTRFVLNNILAATSAVPASRSFMCLSVPRDQPTGFHSDYNLFYIGNQGGIIGESGPLTTLNYKDTTLAAWQQSTGQDQHSLIADPLFIHPNGASKEIDLHVSAGTPVEGAGSLIYTTLRDFDGELRSALTPVDIGADAGNFGSPVTPPDTTKKDTAKKDTASVPPPVVADTASVLRASPNPFSGTLQVTIHAQKAGAAMIAFYNLSGKLIKELPVNVGKGDNSFHIPTDAFSDGVYVLKTVVDGQQATLLVMKRSP